MPGSTKKRRRSWKMTEATKTRAWDYSLKVVAIFMPFLMAGIVWLVAGRIELESRIVVIEANRFTHEDGRALQDHLMELEKINAKRSAEVLLALEAIKNLIPREVPPAWFLDRVAKLEEEVGEIDDRVRHLEKKCPE